MLIIHELKMPLKHDVGDIKTKLAHKLKIAPEVIKDLKIVKRSLDARKTPLYVYQIAFSCLEEDRLLKKYAFLKAYETSKGPLIKSHHDEHVIVVGYGPSGIFAARRLTDRGFKVTVFEKGPRMAKRIKKVQSFFNGGPLDINANVQFGEGGAGTFSDAKLTTRIKSENIPYILDLLIKNGADETIAYTSHAHIGSDKITHIISSITDELIQEGVHFHFDEPIKDLIIEDHQIQGVITDRGEYRSQHVVLATGHSAYDIFKMLDKNGIYMEVKDFALGFRVEHSQAFIDAHQYKGLAVDEYPTPSEYFLRHKDERNVYSFCMCPGGEVIPAMSETKTIVLNGMSKAARNGKYANSALLIQIDHLKDHLDEPLKAYEFVRNYERKAYEISGSYKALAMNIQDYLTAALNPLIFESTYPLGTVLYDLNDFFPTQLNAIFKRALLAFDQKIPGFIAQGIMIAPETRSSSPIRITRNDQGMSVNTCGLYPCGEGSGYGGGIMSCALDGIRIADKIQDNLNKSSL